MKVHCPSHPGINQGFTHVDGPYVFYLRDVFSSSLPLTHTQALEEAEEEDTDPAYLRTAR